MNSISTKDARALGSNSNANVSGLRVRSPSARRSSVKYRSHSFSVIVCHESRHTTRTHPYGVGRARRHTHTHTTPRVVVRHHTKPRKNNCRKLAARELCVRHVPAAEKNARHTSASTHRNYPLIGLFLHSSNAPSLSVLGSGCAEPT